MNIESEDIDNCLETLQTKLMVLVPFNFCLNS
jgi:hypothetical protein